MDVTVSQEQGRVPVAILEVAGRTDSASSDQLLSKLMEVIDDGARYLLLDLSQMPYMSSAGLRVLQQVFNKLRDLSPNEKEREMYEHIIIEGANTSPHLKLLNPTEEVIEVLKMSGFDMLVSIEKNRKEAIASF